MTDPRRPPQAEVGSSSRIRTENQPPTPEHPDPLDPERKPIYMTAVQDQLGPILTEKRDSSGTVVKHAPFTAIALPVAPNTTGMG